MKFILLFGPSAVGKMTVGQELAKITDLKLFHNHVSIELARNLFDFGHPSFKYLSNLIRMEVFQEVAKSDLPGLIFTFVWAIGHPGEEAYVDKITNIFKEKGAEIYYVELEAAQAIRAERNTDAHRLAHKPSKRDIENSNKVFWKHEENFRFNHEPNEFQRPNYLRLRTDDKSAEEAAQLIKAHFNF